MATRLKTSKKTEDIFLRIGQNLGLQPFALSKIAIALSLENNKPLSKEDFSFDSNGIELNRQTITGEYDSLFCSLIAFNEKKELTDDEIFPTFFKAHIDRGAILLEREYRYDKKFYTHLSNLKRGI